MHVKLLSRVNVRHIVNALVHVCCGLGVPVVIKIMMMASHM